MLPVEFAQYAFVAVAAVSALSVVSAIARRIAGPRSRTGAILAARAMSSQAGGDVDALRDEVDQLRAEVGQLRERSGEIDDIQNRLDFAERLLAQVREKPGLPGPR